MLHHVIEYIYDNIFGLNVWHRVFFCFGFPYPSVHVIKAVGTCNSCIFIDHFGGILYISSMNMNIWIWACLWILLGHKSAFEIILQTCFTYTNIQHILMYFSIFVGLCTLGRCERTNHRFMPNIPTIVYFPLE